jgi:hypothetical protein
MGLTRQSASSTSPSTHDGTPGQVVIKPHDSLASMPFISDSNLNKRAINTSGYASVTKQLLGFMKGSRETVTYYRLLRREGNNIRSNISDMTNARNSVDTGYQKIVGLEITLTEEFTFQANQEDANATITGTAKFYPNMNPNIGDVFLMGVGDGRVGYCRITSVVPMTWLQDRIYTANFIVQEFLEHSLSEPLEASVEIVSYFSKENYLGGTAALLAEQSYVQLAKLREMRIILSKHYHQAFFNKTLNTYLHPNGTYDPWVVLFMCGKLRMEDVYTRPKNLLGQAKDEYQRSMWARLEDEHNNTLYLIDPCAQLQGYRQTRMGAFVTELHNRRIVFTRPRAAGLEDYIFSDNFYSGKTTEMTAEELLIHEAITKKTSGGLTTLIVDHLDPVFKLSMDKQFYKIPLCIHLIDMALRNQYREIDAPAMDYAPGQDD